MEKMQYLHTYKRLQEVNNEGPVGVILLNTGTEPFMVAHGDRIAQIVVAPVVQAQVRLAETLDQTARGAGGFGSTGRR